MQTSENIDQVAAALAVAQGKFPVILRDKTVRVTMKSGGSYTFSYAPLESILQAVVPCLSGEGLSLIQSFVLTDGKPSVETRLVDKSGQWISCLIPVIVSDGSGPQEYGSALTYARRYGVTLLLCVSADDDDDANAAAGNKAEVVSKKDIHSPKPDTNHVAADPRILKYAARFRDAMDADVEESEKSRMVFEIHEELTTLKDEFKNELYQAAANELPSNYRNAIRTYVAQHKKTMR